MRKNIQESILVLGSGNFGTCLAQHLGLKGHKVTMWARSKEVAEGINKNHINPKYLNSIKLDQHITAVCDLEKLNISKFSTIVLAVPTQFLRATLTKVKGKVKDTQLIVCAAKGIEVNTEKLPSNIIEEILGDQIAHSTVALSGPSFAIEVAEEQPTGVTVASYSEKHAKRAQEIFHAPKFRAYTSNDPLGLEVAGALKNIIAIAAGACAGFGFKSNSLATLITRGLAEITRIGVKLGANPLTFKGLGGVGDLFLTCSSVKSRNYSVGYALAQGKSLNTALKELGSVAEGVTTTAAAHNLAKRLNVSSPIIDAVYQVLYEQRSIEDVLNSLLIRDAKPEIE